MTTMLTMYLMLTPCGSVWSFDAWLRNRQTDPAHGRRWWLPLPTPSVAEILANIGFDWLFVDGEHGPIETTELAGILQAVNNRSACLYRVPEAAEVPIKKALDLGADGIIVPVQCEYLSLEGLGLLTRTLELVKSRLNAQLDALTARARQADLPLRRA